LGEIEYLHREKNISVKFLDACNVLFAYDENKMARVIQNIVGNAIKFCSHGDRIEVTASNTEGSIFISVADTGEGIPSTEIDSIFERYTQTERSRKKNQ
jgi:signal transduction histidine kinase